MNLIIHLKIALKKSSKIKPEPPTPVPDKQRQQDTAKETEKSGFLQMRDAVRQLKLC